MSTVLKVKPDKDPIVNILSEVQKGNINIPVFQRDVVWETKEMIMLLDSIQKGYSIGSLLFWEPEAEC